MKKYFGLIFILLLAMSACQDKSSSASNTFESFEGVWKVTGPKGQIYYMTLKKDGSGTTTREGGEFGTWELNGGDLEAKWIPKNLKIQFSSGSARVSNLPSDKVESKQKTTAVKVDKIPE